jgi:hypothetical protein
MILKEEDKVDDKLELCEPCELGKLLRHVRKTAALRNLKLFDEVHIDVVMIKPKSIRKIKYATVFIEKAISVRWAYFYELKNGAYDALVIF